MTWFLLSHGFSCYSDFQPAGLDSRGIHTDSSWKDALIPMFSQVLGLICSASKIFFPPLHLNDQENLQNQSYSSFPVTSHIPKATNSSDTKQPLPTRAPHSSSDSVLHLVYLGLLASSHPSVRMIMAVRDRNPTQISFDRAGSTVQW